MRKIAITILFALTITTVPLHAEEGGGGGGDGGYPPELTVKPNVMSPPRKAPPKLPAGTSTKFSDGSAITFSGPGLTRVSVTTSSGNSLSGRLIKDPPGGEWIYKRVVTFRADNGSLFRAYFLGNGMAKIEKRDPAESKQPELIWTSGR